MALGELAVCAPPASMLEKQIGAVTLSIAFCAFSLKLPASAHAVSFESESRG